MVASNDLQHAAGTLTGDTLHVKLNVSIARWQPDTTIDRWLTVGAFAEDGHAPSIPGPLLRVPVGGRIALTLHNTLSDTVWLLGFGARTEVFVGDTLMVPPRATREFNVAAPGPGTTGYFGIMRPKGELLEGGPGRTLGGVLQVGEPRPGERLLALNIFQMLMDSVRKEGDAPLWAINGRTWPATERFAFDVGDSVRWRIVDLTGDEHPMHLHGFHFQVDGISTWNSDTTFAQNDRQLAVTTVPPPAGSVAITWVPTRAGQWLFHCHKAPHMGETSHLVLMGDTTEHPVPSHVDPAEHMRTGMSGLILGITVRGAAHAPDESAPAQRIRLLVQRRDSVFGSAEGLGYVIQRGAEPARDSIESPGPVLLLRRGELSEITVVNHLATATTVHWHGLELDSYYDGVGGWSGVTGRVAPMLQPGDSFVVRIRPVRAGTFIYHTHLSEMRQLEHGLLGALLVLDSNERYDPATDHVVIVHERPVDTLRVVANGAFAPITVSAGVPQRFRFITLIGDAGATYTLTRDSVPWRWRPVAKDGALLSHTQEGPARVRLNPGETFDAVYVPRRSDPPLRLAVKSYESFALPIRIR